MRKLFLFITVFLCIQIKLKAQVVFELDSNQSMLMFGKGPGQDATINPFEGEDCYAIVKNLGNEIFSVRIQNNGQVVEILSVNIKETKKIRLLVGHELYLDAETKNKAKASVAYEKISQ